MTNTAQPEIGSYVDAGGIKTNYLEAGSGPPVVLVRGHWSQIEWAADFNALLARFLGRDARD